MTRVGTDSLATAAAASTAIHPLAFTPSNRNADSVGAAAARAVAAWCSCGSMWTCSRINRGLFLRPRTYIQATSQQSVCGVRQRPGLLSGTPCTADRCVAWSDVCRRGGTVIQSDALYRKGGGTTRTKPSIHAALYHACNLTVVKMCDIWVCETKTIPSRPATLLQRSAEGTHAYYFGLEMEGDGMCA